MILKRYLILGTWGSASIVGVACKRQETKAPGTTESKHHQRDHEMVNSADGTAASVDMPETSRDEATGSVPIARSMLRKLPRIVYDSRTGGGSNDLFLGKAGVPPAAMPAVGKSAVRAYQSAKALMKKSTASLRFDLGTRVEIEPVAVEQLDSIMQNFKREITSKVAPDLAVFLENRLALQLQGEFGDKMWATLERTGTMSLSDLVSVPLELRGLSFLIETQKADGTIDRVYMSPSAPAYQESKRYFFLKVPDGVTGDEGLRPKLH